MFVCIYIYIYMYVQYLSECKLMQIEVDPLISARCFKKKNLPEVELGQFSARQITFFPLSYRCRLCHRLWRV